MDVTKQPAFEAGKNAGQASAKLVREWFQSGGMVERIAGGVMAVAVVAVVLTELFSLSIISNATGPFSGLITQVENVGTAALTLVVLGFLAAAGGAVLSMFRGGF